MSRIILCTSSSGLDNLDIKHNIQQIRLRIHINNVEFIDGKNIAFNRLKYLMTDVGASAVHTSPAPIEEVIEQFEGLKKKGYTEVFIVCVSSQISESYRFIKLAAQQFEDDMTIHVYDCKDVNLCEAMLALDAEHLTQKGYTMLDIEHHLEKLRSSHQMFFAVKDLTYLIKNKKLSTTAGFLANLLNIKPVIHVTEEGNVVPINKVRHYKKTLQYLLEECSDVFNQKDSFAYVLSSGIHTLDEHFAEMLKEITGLEKVMIFPVSSISLANHGPTGVGVCYFEGRVPISAKLLKSNKANYI